MAFVYILISATILFDLETTNDSHGNAAGLESNRQKKLRGSVLAAICGCDTTLSRTYWI